MLETLAGTNLAIAGAAAVVGYLFGSVSFARLIFAHLRPGTDPDLIRTPTLDGEAELVSHAVGATNVMMVFGPRWGMLTTALDAAKAFLPTLALGLLFPGQPYDLICAVFVLVGHLWPVWYRFQGGGGNSSILGMLLAIDPLSVLVTHAGGYLVGRFFPAFSFLAGVALTIPWFLWRNGLGSPEVVFSICISAVYLAGQMPEIRAFRSLGRQGHELDVEHVMRMMRGSARARAEANSEQGDGEAL